MQQLPATFLQRRVVFARRAEPVAPVVGNPNSKRAMPFLQRRGPPANKDVFDIFGLPTEVLMMIFDWLWYGHWRAARRVCRTFCALIPVPRMSVYRGLVARAYTGLLWTSMTLAVSGDDAPSMYRKHRPHSIVAKAPLDRHAYTRLRDYIGSAVRQRPKSVTTLQPLLAAFRVLVSVTQFGSTRLRLLLRTESRGYTDLVVFDDLGVLPSARAAEFAVLRAGPIAEAVYTDTWHWIDLPHLVPPAEWEPCCSAPDRPFVPVQCDDDVPIFSNGEAWSAESSSSSSVSDDDSSSSD